MKGRILCIDYGLKRTGLAWTDAMQLIANGLDCVPTDDLEVYLTKLFSKENIVSIVLGFPTKMDGSDTNITEQVREVGQKLKEKYPTVELHFWDERFTSKQAMETMILAGIPKNKRSDKKIINTIAATIILQEFLTNQQ